MAGGLKEFAKAGDIVVVRVEGTQQATFPVQLQRREEAEEAVAEHSVEAGRYRYRTRDPSCPRIASCLGGRAGPAGDGAAGGRADSLYRTRQRRSPCLDQEPLPEPTGPIGPATTDSQRPGVTPTVQTQRLDLSFSFYGALDQTSVTDVRHVFSSEPLLNDRVGYGGGTANLTYTYAGKDNTFAAVGGSGLRNYTATTTSVFYPSDVYGGLTFSRRLSRRVRLTGREIVTFTPYYTFGGSQSSGAFTDLVPSLSATPQLTSPGVAPQFDQAVNRVDAVNNDTTVGVTWTLNRKSSITAGYSYYHTDASASYRVNNMGANGSYQYQKSRYLSLHAGYGFYRNQLPELIQLPGPIVDHYDSHNIDVGVGYRRPLSFSRRSIISFNVGSTVITDGVKPYFYVTGDGSLSHQLSQFWTLALSYNRGVSRSGGLAAPFVSDVGALSVGGC